MNTSLLFLKYNHIFEFEEHVSMSYPTSLAIVIPLSLRSSVVFKAVVLATWWNQQAFSHPSKSPPFRDKNSQIFKHLSFSKNIQDNCDVLLSNSLWNKEVIFDTISRNVCSTFVAGWILRRTRSKQLISYFVWSVTQTRLFLDSCVHCFCICHWYQPESLWLSKQRVFFFLRMAHLNNKDYVCKQISPLFTTSFLGYSLFLLLI